MVVNEDGVSDRKMVEMETTKFKDIKKTKNLKIDSTNNSKTINDDIKVSIKPST